MIIQRNAGHPGETGDVKKEASGLYSTFCDPYYNIDFTSVMQTCLSEVQSLK